MKDTLTNNMIMPSQLYAQEAATLAELTRNSRKTPKLRKQAEELEKACILAVEQSEIKNVSEVWQNMLKKHAGLKPRRTVTTWGNVYEKTEAQCLNDWIICMNRFLISLSAVKLDYIKLVITRKKYSEYGTNFTCRSEITNGWTDKGSTPVNSGGYCKLSSAVDLSLRDSVTITRFLIENWHLVKDCYGVDAWKGLPQIDIAGKGIETLEAILKAAGWKNCDYKARLLDKNGYTVGAYYSMN